MVVHKWIQILNAIVLFHQNLHNIYSFVDAAAAVAYNTVRCTLNL